MPSRVCVSPVDGAAGEGRALAVWLRRAERCSETSSLHGALQSAVFQELGKAHSIQCAGQRDGRLETLDIAPGGPSHQGRKEARAGRRGDGRCRGGRCRNWPG